jgi:NAD(P)-dependent dehydrogenase (short-subunit alcohol dehydrogenase family)
MKAAGDALKKSGHGSVVNVSSMYGIVGSGVSPAYHAAKGAVRVLTKTTALGWARAGVRVNSVHPGYIDTPILGDADRDALTGATPMGRLGQPEEIAAMITFLASDDASFATGAEFVVDGGYTAG